MSARGARPATSPSCAANTPRSPPRMRARRRTSCGCRSPTRAAMRSSSTGRALTCRRSRRFLGTKVLDDYPIAELVDYIDWTPFFQTWELTGKYPGHPRRRESRARRRARSTTMRTRCSTRSWPSAGSRPSAVVGFWPANAQGDDIRVFADEARADADRDAAHAAPAAVQARGPRQRGARRFRRAARQRRWPITSAPSPSPPASARTRSPTASSAPTTTIPPSWSRRWPTGWRKPSPSGCTSACARNSGAMRRTRRSTQRRADRREISRHPPGARLSGAARPHREGHAVPPARRPSASASS